MQTTTQSVPAKRVLMLMSTVGGGHISAANSIAEALSKLYGNQITIEMIDVLKEYAPQPFDRVPEAYQLMLKSPVAWKNFYDIGDSVRRAKMISLSTARYASRQSKKLLKNHPADIIISTYHFANSPILEALFRLKLDTPFVTVVTDLVTVPPMWFDARTTVCITPTPEAAQLGIKSGLDPSTIKVIGMPVSGKFTPPNRPKTEIKRSLGWDPDLPAIMVMAGGEGVGSLDQLAEVLAPLNANIAIITGKNEPLYAKLNTADKTDNLFVYGFIDNIHELMQASDILVTKAGPGSIMEALNTHLPLVLYSKIYGQEDGNVSFVIDHGAGIWQPKITDMPKDIQQLLDEPEKLSAMSAAAGSISQPNARLHIAKLIGEMIDY